MKRKNKLDIKFFYFLRISNFRVHEKYKLLKKKYFVKIF